MNNESFEQISQFANLFKFEKVFTFLLGVAVLIAVVRAVTFFADKLEKSFPARRLLISQIVTIFSFFAYIFGINVLFFAIIRPPNQLMLAAGGSMAVALGLSLKDLVASLVAGVILLFDRPFQVGDRVTFAGEYGEIQSIGLRAVRMITLNDNLVTIPNNRFISDVVSSGNAGALDMMVVVKFYLEIDADIDLARAKLHDIIATSNYVFLKKPITQIITEEIIGGRPVLALIAKSYVLDVRYEKALETDIYHRANSAFRAAQIQRPKLPLAL